MELKRTGAKGSCPNREYLAGGTEENQKKKPEVSVDGVSAMTGTKHLQNKTVKCYYRSNRLGLLSTDLMTVFRSGCLSREESA